MDKLLEIMLLLKFILLVFSVCFGYLMGYILTETKYRLSKWKLFDFKAFICRPCLSFHIAWVTSTAIALAFEDWVMVVAGVMFALCLWAGLRIDEHNKTIKVE